MSRPTGRPSLGRKKRVHTLKLSFNDDEFDVIDIKASRAGMCKTVYGREAALNAEVTGVLTDEEKMLLHELKKLGPNLNQVPIMPTPRDSLALQTRLKISLTASQNTF